MRFELIGKRIVNLDHVEQITKKDLSPAMQTALGVEQSFDIEFHLASGDIIAMGYKTAIDRDAKFDNLAKSFSLK